jgi:hypothetical protein
VPKDNLPATVDPYGELELWLDALPVFDIEALAGRTIAHTLSAETPDEVLADPTAAGLADFADRVVYLVAVTGALLSTYDTGPTRYITLDIADPDTEEHHTVTTGSPYVMARAFKLSEMGALPCLVRVLALESKNNPGRTSLWITKP